MRSKNTTCYNSWAEDVQMNNIIYLREIFPLEDTAPRRCRKRKQSGDMIWNFVFGALCLSVLVCLFLH